MAEEKDHRIRRWYLPLLGVAAILGLAVFTSANIENTDGWLVITNTTNTTIINFNTTRPTTCGPGEFSYWNGVNWLCAVPAGTNLNTTGVNETGYSIHGCGGTSCEIGYYSLGY